jgi:hypothetical protein
MAKVVRRRRRRTYDEAYSNSLKYWCFKAGYTVGEIRHWAQFNEEAKAHLLSLEELAENDALPYRKRIHKRGA